MLLNQAFRRRAGSEVQCSVPSSLWLLSKILWSKLDLIFYFAFLWFFMHFLGHNF